MQGRDSLDPHGHWPFCFLQYMILLKEKKEKRKKKKTIKIQLASLMTLENN